MRRTLSLAAVVALMGSCIVRRAPEATVPGIVDRIEQTPNGPVAVVEVEDHGHFLTTVNMRSRKGWTEGTRVEVPAWRIR